MKVKVIGIQEQDYKLDSGYSFTGLKLHVIDLGTEYQDLVGHLVTNFKISADSPLYMTPISVGKEYTVYFNQKGQPEFFVEEASSK